MKLAVVLKGVSFLRALGPLIHFAKEPGIDLYIAYPRQRTGKEYDAIDANTLVAFVPSHRQLVYESEEMLGELLQKHGIQIILTQDPSHHFTQLCRDSRLKVYGIAVFIDSLHHAWRVKSGDSIATIPHKIYFPSQYIEDKFFAIGSYKRSEMRHVTLGSPLFDNVLFLPQAPLSKSVVYIAPPAQHMRWLMPNKVAQLFKHAHRAGYAVLAKTRAKTPLSRHLQKYCDEIYTEEKVLPYTSFKLINEASIHICGYSTSIFEARFLNKPTLNLDLNLRRWELGDFVKNYGLQDLYNSKTCLTPHNRYEQAFDQLQELSPNAYRENEQFIHSPSVVPASRQILQDIMYENEIPVSE